MRLKDIYTITFLIGICFSQLQSELLSLRYALILLPIATLAIRWRAFWIPLTLTAGFFWAILHAVLILQSNIPANLQGKAVLIQGEIISIPQHNIRSSSFIFRTDRIEGIKLSRDLAISWWRPTQAIKAGTRWQFMIRIKPIYGTLNPDGFDLEKWYFTRGIRYRGTILSDHEKNKSLIETARHHLRQRLSDWINASLMNHASLGFIKGISIGIRTDISARQWDIFKKTGTNHLLAISGLHIGFVFATSFLLINSIWRNFGHVNLLIPASRVSWIVASGAAAGYAMMSGFLLPTQRALTMLLLIAIGIFLHRRCKPGTILLRTLALLLILQPLMVLSAGFWLSFSAVAIISVAHVLSGRIKHFSVSRKTLFSGVLIKCRHGLAHWFRIQLILSIMMMPVLVYLFNSFSILTPLANLIAIPIAMLVVPMALLAVTFHLLHCESVAVQLLNLAADLADVLQSILLTIANIDQGYLHLPYPNGIVLFLGITGVALLIAPKAVPGKILGLVLLLPLIFTSPVKPAEGEYHLTMLDVGQGLAVLVTTRQHNMLYDTGRSWNQRSDVGSHIIAPYLHRQGVSHLDLLVVSHQDDDHAGGLPGLTRSIDIARSLTNKTFEFKSDFCRSGLEWSWDGVHFSVLSPSHSQVDKYSENDLSCVLRIEGNSGVSLLTGDIERKMETWLVRNKSHAIDADILLVPHHGSNSSSTTHFLKAVSPKFALVSNGRDNRFGHPHKAVRGRYAKQYIPLLTTGDNGAITIKLMRKGLEVSTARASGKRYWHHPKGD